MMAVSAFTAIVVPSKDQLVATLDTVIAGVKAGELDEHLTQYAKARGVPKRVTGSEQRYRPAS